MSTRIRFKISASAMIAAALGILIALPPLAHSVPGGRRNKTWMRSGTRYSLVAVEGRRVRPLPGKFSVLCSAKEVRSLAARDDTLWIGSEGGLFAYCMRDGVISAVTGPSSISVRSVAFDDGGALWVGGDNGISVRLRGSWKFYVKESLPFFGRIRCLVPDETRFWIGTYGNGCGYIIDDALTVLSARDSLLDERVLSIAEETPGTVYFGTASGLIAADTLGWKSLRYGSRLPIGAVNDMAFDEDGNLFLAIAARGVAVFSFGRVRTFGSAQDAPGADVHALSLDPMGRMWAAGSSGVFIFDGSEWAPCPASGLASRKHRYLSIHHDDEGNSYLGTDDGRVLSISRDGVKEIVVPQLFAESRVARVRADAGAVWLIAGKSIYGGKGSLARVAPPELYADEMTDIAAGEAGELWATTRFGILHFTGRTWEVFNRENGLPTVYFTRVARDPAGKVWFTAFDGGVVTFAAGKWNTDGMGSGLPANIIDDLALDGAGTPWIVTRSGEVAHFVQGAWARMDLPRRPAEASDTTRATDSLYQFDQAIRLLSNAAPGPRGSTEMKEYCLGKDKAGSCLVGTRAGAYRLISTGWQLIELPKQMKGLRPTAVLGTARGDIWLGTAGGGVLVHRNNEWLRIGASTGLSDDYVRSLCEDHQGTVWIGTQFGGLTKFSPPNGM